MLVGGSVLGSPRVELDALDDELPGRGQFAALLGVPDDRVTGLLRVLIARCLSDASHSERLSALEHLGRFVVRGSSHPPLHRLELLVLAIERVPGARQRVLRCMREVIAATQAERLLAVIGLPNDRGLYAELTDRLADRLLPRPPDEDDLAELIGRIVQRSADHAWLGPEIDGLLDRLAVALAPAWTPLVAAAADAIGLLSTRIAALGMSDTLRSLRLGRGVQESSFYQLARAPLADVHHAIAQCRAELEHIHARLEDVGVSIEVVYTLDAIGRGLTRIGRLQALATGETLAPDARRALIAVLAADVVGERSVGQVVTDNFRLMARKVIERAGRTGEHYVASSRREYWQMLRSAAGGGVITAGTAIAKIAIKWQQFPIFIDGVLSSLAFAASFLVIQFLGFTLATKQPSMTAAALAGAVRESGGPGRLDELVALIARIARSQFAAAVGNVATVIVVARLFDVLWRQVTGGPFLDEGTALGVIASFDPLGSGTVPFAALTGVLLWMSSLVAGWFENWTVYRRLPEAIEHHQLGRRFGRARMARLARGLERHAAGLGGSVSLGFFLGMTPAFARFVGLPIDVRHVTLSSGALTLAMASVGVDAIGWSPILWAWAGIAIIGLLNFGVSFTLALMVALRARDVPRPQRRTLPWAVARSFLRRPWTFFWPPRDPIAPPPPPPLPPPDPAPPPPAA